MAIFADQARDLVVALYDRAAGVITFPYETDRGQRLRPETTGSMPFGEGLTSIVISGNRPLRFATLEDQNAAGAVVSPYGDEEEASQSWLGVPIPAGGEVIGAIILGHDQPNAYSEADERLVSTVASSMGVALANARLFDETKRLLAETDQRAAELALINEIGSALAAQLDFQAIIELVGERVRALFDATSIFVGLYDPTTKVISFPYEVEEGERYHTEPFVLGPGLSSIVIQSRSALRIGTAEESVAKGAITAGAVTQSWLGVPIPAGDRVLGVIALESMAKDAYTESDERVLTTLASSMGVALENARLFDETKRLLAETDQRNAELALINEIGSALAAELDFGAIIEVVGDRLRGIFAAQARDLSTSPCTTGPPASISFPYWIDNGTRITSSRSSSVPG